VTRANSKSGDVLPSGNLTWLLKMAVFNGKIHYKWPFSIAMLNYQRVDSIDWLMEAKSPILVLDVSDQASSMCKIRETHG